MLDNIFRRSADRKQRVHKKSSFEIASASSSGGQGNYGSARGKTVNS